MTYNDECTRRRLRAVALCAAIVFAWLGLQGSVSSSPQCPVVRYDKQSTGRADGYVHQPTFEWSVAANSPTAPVIGSDGSLYFGTADRCFYSYNSSGGVSWMYRTDATIGGSAAVCPDGTIYVGMTGEVVALTSSGSTKWTNPFSFASTANPTSIAVDSSGTAYFGTDDSHIYAVNPNGTLKWSCSTGGPVRYSLSMAPDGSTVYATAADGKEYAVNAANGALKWKTAAISPAYNSAVADDGTVYVSSLTGMLYSFAPDGTQKWTFQSQSKVTCAPAIAKDGTVYFGSQDTNLYALDPSGHMKWCYRTGGPIYSAPTIDSAGDIIFGTWPGNLTALDPANGSLEWIRALGATMYNSPLINKTGSIYAVCTNGMIIKYGSLPEPSSLVAMAGLLAVFGGQAMRRRKT